MGGVTINVQVPVSDDRFPSINGALRRVYIPSGIQHMNGAEALRYARSRHGSNDFDRGARQQRVLLSLREQADPQALIPQLPQLIDAIGSAVSTDIPPDQLAPLLGLASQIDTKNIRSYVFAPPLYGTESRPGAPVYSIQAKVSKIRAAVKTAFTTDPADEAQRQELASEGAAGVGPQRDERLGPRHRDRGLPRLPRAGGLRAAPEARRRRPGKHGDRRLQRRRGQHARHDRLPAEDVRGDRHDQDRPGDRRPTS